MTRKHLLSILFMFVLACPVLLLAQQPASPAAAEAPLLTLEDAVSIALSNNRLVKNSALEAQKFDFRLSTAQTRRLPQFQFNVLGGELMHSFDFTFDQGAFGTYPGVGPIPGTQTKIRQPARFTTYVTGAFDQPLTQQYRIGLAIRATELGRQIAKEDVRAERQKIAAEVRNAYFNLVATQAGVEAARQVVTTLEEAQRLTLRYVAEKTVLRGDSLEVDARLAQARYDLSVAQDGLATQRENLNQLLGRDLGVRFRVDPMLEADASDLPLDTARARASQNRPEIQQARLKEKQAEYDRRIAKADYIPDLSLSVRYQGAQQHQSASDERWHGGLFPELGAVRLGTSPQQCGGKSQDGRAGPQRHTRDRNKDRGRSRSQVPQVARGGPASQGRAHRTRSGRGAIPGHRQQVQGTGRPHKRLTPGAGSKHRDGIPLPTGAVVVLGCPG